MRRKFALVVALACSLACASEPAVPTCQERLVDSPPPPDACLQQADGREYLRQVAAELGDDLMSWRSAPGSAEVTLGFDAAASVASVCLGPTQGATVSSRSAAAAAALRALPPGPACLSNRRLVLAWESPVVTEEEIRNAKLACQPATFGVRNDLAACRLSRTCGTERVIALEEQLEATVAECVLQELPLTLTIPSGRTYVNFLPSQDRVPSKERALSALVSCARPVDEPALLACMQEHGWEPAR